MITQQQIDQLLEFKDGDCLVTSCYLDLNRTELLPQTMKIRAKDLLQLAHRDLESKAGSHAARESLRRDFERIDEFLKLRLVRNQDKGLAIFACSGQKFWHVFGLPRPVRYMLIADHVPYVHPLTAILGEYHRYCVVLVDQRHGQIVEIYMDEVLERSDIIERSAPSAKQGTQGDRGDERTIQGHQDRVVSQHYERVADAAFKLFKRDRFDWLVLGGRHGQLAEFKKTLHPYLQERLVGEIVAEPGKTPLREVLRKTLEISAHIERQHEAHLVTDLIRKSKLSNLAITGLTPALNALSKGAARLLLVEEDFEAPGFACYDCHYLSLEQQNCPQCSKPLESCPDVVDEAIEAALRKKCDIEHVHGVTPLRDAGRIGAFLRFPA
jgi:peptide subunit release factor 1 (eRF1)